MAAIWNAWHSVEFYTQAPFPSSLHLRQCAPELYLDILRLLTSRMLESPCERDWAMVYVTCGARLSWDNWLERQFSWGLDCKLFFARILRAAACYI
jgi:hypothetical protein